MIIVLSKNKTFICILLLLLLPFSPSLSFSFYGNVYVSISPLFVPLSRPLARRGRGEESQRKKREEKGKERNITHRHYGVVTTSPLILLPERDTGVEGETGRKGGGGGRGMRRREGARSWGREGASDAAAALLFYLP